MPSTEPVIHVVSKADHKRHDIIQLPHGAQSTPLTASSVRAKCTLLAITGNTYSYARGGVDLHWWDAYPVPDTSGYTKEEWGIVPAWGYADVVDSQIPTIPSGSRLFGFWPTAAMLVDLQLQQSDVPGHWQEVSKQRATLMTLYNRYILVDSTGDLEEDIIVAGCKPVWQAGWLLSRYIFAPRLRARIHPLGVELPWTENDADLSAAVVINLSASSKTGQAFSWSLRKRDHQRDGPLAVLEATSNVAALSGSHDEGPPTRVASYEDILGSECLQWLFQHCPTRVVVVDFGAAANVLAALVGVLGQRPEQVPITVVGVGGQTTVLSAPAMQQTQAVGKEVGKIPMNTSGLLDKAIAVEGAAIVFDDMEAAWKQCRADSLYADQRIQWSEGVDGIHGAWARLVAGDVSGTSYVGVKLA